MAALAELLSYLPDNHLSDPIVEPATDPPDRKCVAGPAVVPDRPTATYDVREVVAVLTSDVERVRLLEPGGIAVGGRDQRDGLVVLLEAVAEGFFEFLELALAQHSGRD